MNTKVAIVELSNSHDECIYSQLQFLQSEVDYDVTLICNETIANRLKDVLKRNLSNITVKKMEVRRRVNLPLDIIRLRSYLIKQGFNKVIFNTATGNIIKLLMLLPFPKSIEFIGIIHNIDKLTGSANQDIISRRVKKYFVLSEYLKENAPKKYNMEYFYPMFFAESETLKIEKSEDEIWICIPGQIEQKRRDYEGLFTQLEANKLNQNIKFILLGSGDSSFIESNINTLGLAKKFVWWYSFVGTPIFENYLKKCDYILPLIHLNHKSYSLYENQISGTFNLAYGYGKPMLMEESFSLLEDFEESIFYKTDELIKVINSLEKQVANPYVSKKFSFEFQKRKYIDFIT